MKRNKRYLIYFIIVIALIVTLLVIPLSQPVMSQRDTVIVIDAGHGGFDGGAEGRLTGIKEDGLNLAVSKKLEAMFKNQGYTVIMTREDEDALGRTKDEDMKNRKQIIENSNADIVISIHMNKFVDTSCHGPVVFYHEDSAEGEKLAKLMQVKLVELLKPERPRVEKPESYFILRSGEAPCVLVECGFLSNERDEQLLQTEEYQELCASAIFKGAMLYLTQRYTTSTA
jgi:N-acetylmuramoyl-L-alanine amidase